MRLDYRIWKGDEIKIYQILWKQCVVIFYLWSFCGLFTYNQSSIFIIGNLLIMSALLSYLLNIKLTSSTQDLLILRDPRVYRKTVHSNMPRQLRNAVTAIAVQPVKSDINMLVNFWPWRKSFITKCGDYVLTAGLRLECSITVRIANARRFNWTRWPLFITGFLFCTKSHRSRSDISRHGNARQSLNTLPWVL